MFPIFSNCFLLNKFLFLCIACLSVVLAFSNEDSAKPFEVHTLSNSISQCDGLRFSNSSVSEDVAFDKL